MPEIRSGNKALLTASGKPMFCLQSFYMSAGKQPRFIGESSPSFHPTRQAEGQKQRARVLRGLLAGYPELTATND
eukprot:6032075-Amphidinium_carterae.3